MTGIPIGSDISREEQVMAIGGACSPLSMSQPGPTVEVVTVTFYETLHLMGRSVGRGPINRRAIAILEFISGHGSVLAQFRAKSGRWAVVLETARRSCADCDANAGSRFLQFMALEDGISVIGECGSNQFLDSDQQFTPAQERQLRLLGWNEPRPSQTPNWFFEANSDADLLALEHLTDKTLREVFALRDRDVVEVSFNEVIVEGY